MMAALAGVVNDRQATTGHQHHSEENQQGSPHVRLIVPMAENTPPIFAKSVLVFDLSPDVDETEFCIDIGSLCSIDGASPLLRLSSWTQNSTDFPNLDFVKSIEIVVIRPFDLYSSAKFSSWKMSPVYKSKMCKHIGLIDQGCHTARSYINVGAQLSPSSPYLRISNPNQSTGNKGEQNTSDGNNFRIVNTNKLGTAL
mgnify:CR=1 FL=1